MARLNVLDADGRRKEVNTGVYHSTRKLQGRRRSAAAVEGMLPYIKKVVHYPLESDLRPLEYQATLKASEGVSQTLTLCATGQIGNN